MLLYIDFVQQPPRGSYLPDKQSTDRGRQQGDQQSGQHHVNDAACDDHIAFRVNQPLEAAEDDADRPEVGE